MLSSALDGIVQCLKYCVCVCPVKQILFNYGTENTALVVLEQTLLFRHRVHSDSLNTGQPTIHFPRSPFQASESSRLGRRQHQLQVVMNMGVYFPKIGWDSFSCAYCVFDLVDLLKSF